MAGRKKITDGTKQKQVHFQTQEKKVEKIGYENCQEIATLAVNKAYECGGTCEVCICMGKELLNQNL